MLNLIFDLDATLIDSSPLDDNDTNLIETNKRYNEVFYINVNKHGYLCFCRAYSTLLLRYCFKNYNVGF